MDLLKLFNQVVDINLSNYQPNYEDKILIFYWYDFTVVSYYTGNYYRQPLALFGVDLLEILLLPKVRAIIFLELHKIFKYLGNCSAH